MPTVSKTLADKIVEGHGHYMDDPLVVEIIEYDNAFDGSASYGLVYQGRRNGYTPSRYVQRPRTYWKHEVKRRM